jgi:hypothetical protein
VKFFGMLKVYRKESSLSNPSQSIKEKCKVKSKNLNCGFSSLFIAASSLLVD